jgi:hypothetical protein
MSVIPKITCRRCGREYSGLRSRCPYCGTGRSKSAERIPLRTSSENAGTPAAEHAAVNTKWQMLFGGILLLAVCRHRAHHREPERQSKYPERCRADPAGDGFQCRAGRHADTHTGADPDSDADSVGHEHHHHVPRQQAHGVRGQGRR